MEGPEDVKMEDVSAETLKLELELDSLLTSTEYFDCNNSNTSFYGHDQGQSWDGQNQSRNDGDNVDYTLDTSEEADTDNPSPDPDGADGGQGQGSDSADADSCKKVVKFLVEETVKTNDDSRKRKREGDEDSEDDSDSENDDFSPHLDHDHVACDQEKKELKAELEFLKARMENLYQRHMLLEDLAVLQQGPNKLDKFFAIREKFLALGKSRKVTDARLVLSPGSSHLINCLKRVFDAETLNGQDELGVEEISMIETEVALLSTSSSSGNGNVEEDQVDGVAEVSPPPKPSPNLNTVLSKIGMEDIFPPSSLGQRYKGALKLKKARRKEKDGNTDDAAGGTVEEREKGILTKCVICETTVNSLNLRQHMFVHAGIFYRCPQCDALSINKKKIRRCLRDHGTPKDVMWQLNLPQYIVTNDKMTLITEEEGKKIVDEYIKKQSSKIMSMKPQGPHHFHSSAGNDHQNHRSFNNRPFYPPKRPIAGGPPPVPVPLFPSQMAPPRPRPPVSTVSVPPFYRREAMGMGRPYISMEDALKTQERRAQLHQMTLDRKYNEMRAYRQAQVYQPQQLQPYQMPQLQQPYQKQQLQQPYQQHSVGFRQPRAFSQVQTSYQPMQQPFRRQEAYQEEDSFSDEPRKKRSGAQRRKLKMARQGDHKIAQQSNDSLLGGSNFQNFRYFNFNSDS